jgi:hypothetical protein
MNPRLRTVKRKRLQIIFAICTITTNFIGALLAKFMQSALNRAVKSINLRQVGFIIKRNMGFALAWFKVPHSYSSIFEISSVDGGCGIGRFRKFGQ